MTVSVLPRYILPPISINEPSTAGNYGLCLAGIKAVRLLALIAEYPPEFFSNGCC
jgi:hypothetical protein